MLVPKERVSVSQLKAEFEALQIQVKLILLSQRVAQLAYNVPGIFSRKHRPLHKDGWEKCLPKAAP